MSEPWSRREVAVVAARTTLAGSLWRPESRPVATVLMHPGSGPADRDNDGYFPPIRRHLLECGIAVCSFDKRGVGGSSGRWQDAGIVEQAGDVAAAVAWLATESGDAPIGLFGHSQGGWVVLEAARSLPQLAFVVTNSGPGVSPADQERFSAEARADDAGLTELEIDEVLGHFEWMVARLRAGTDFEEVQAGVDAASRSLGRDLAGLMFVPGSAEEWALATSMIDYDPRAALSRITVPLLAMFGADDAVVPVESSVAVYRDAVRPGLLDVVVMAGGSHRIQHGEPPQLVDGYLERLSAFIAAAV